MKHQRCIKKTILMFLLLLSGIAVNAQHRITGTVKDAQGEPIVGANVLERGVKTNGTITDINGNFVISTTLKNSILTFSFIGYESKAISVGTKTKIEIILEENSQMLDDVVVVGYGTQKRSDLTGSVASVSMKDMMKAPVKSFDEALAGRIAGVQVVSSEGQPGASIDVVIRGGNSVTQDNSPLYVIDGFPVENPGNESVNPINAIDPADIESIDILKDASATAIYGARAANGVVIIQTKQGSEGKTTISYNGYYGWQSSTKRLDVLDPYEFVKLQNEIDPVKTKTLYLDKVNSDGTKETVPLDYYKNIEGINWEEQIMRTAPMQNHHLSLLGGTKLSKYNASFSYLNQKGIIINSGFTRGQARLGYEREINKRMKVNFNVSYARVKRYGTPVSTSNYNNELNLLFSVWAYRPISLINSDVNLLEVPNDPEIEQTADFRYNPIITTQNELRETTEESLVANAFLEYMIVENLKLKVSGGYTRRFSQSDTFNNSLSRSGNETTNNRVNGGQGYTNTTTWLNENTLNYNLRINKNQTINLLGGMTLQGSKYRSFAAYSKLLPNENLGVSGLDEGTPMSVNATSTEWALVSFLGRANYNIKSKYLFTASFRSDGSSRFAPGHKWGHFASGAFAWRINTEKFLKDWKFLSNAKLRLSWGMTGNNNVGNFSYYAGYSTPVNAGYMFNNQFVTGSYPSSMGNSDLTWETTHQYDAGLDLGFFKQRLTLTIDWYRKNTKDLLLNASLPTSTGYSSQFQNIGSVRNEGLEISLGAVIFDTKDFKWNSSFNISFNKNKVLELADNEYSLLTAQRWGDDWQLIPGYIARLGGPVAAFYGHIWDGVYQYDDFDKVGDKYILKDNITSNGEPRASVQPGDIKYRDLNGDRVVDDNDKTVIGNPLPVHIGGFNNNFYFRGFDLNVFLQWSYGNDIYNANKLMLESGYKYNTNQYASYANRWSPENQNSNIPAAKGSSLKTYSTRIVEDGSYLRLKTVSLGYTLPVSLTQKWGISLFRIYASAQNIYTWTGYSGYDPEVSIRRTALTPGFDYSAYPKAMTITLGTNITF
ncbi:TonB-dependent receptor [Bacteroides ovatus]|jgi:TonB-linked SusC/RagA family outer membrane protein|uniref:SusC/RagA family TonB-linked outer membrane protein n=1 Tax=Bacteroides ovatus TaxID=28116 RepID=UPI0032C0F736